MTADTHLHQSIFAPYQQAIAATARDSLHMTLSPSSKLSLWQSKVGGNAYYVPTNFQHPRNAQGQLLFMLAQINCAELPANTLFPATGILQFYIDADDDLLGLDFENPLQQTGFQVVFHDTVTEDETQLQTVSPPDWEYTPVDQEYAISFHPQSQYISVGDEHYAQRLFSVPQLHEALDTAFASDAEADAFFEAYETAFPATGHRLGGYPYFTQSDPRHSEDLQEYVLLLQIDTDEGIMWGDAGVGNFFIHPDDLKRQDFSKVLYNWDCC